MIVEIDVAGAVRQIVERGTPIGLEAEIAKIPAGARIIEASGERVVYEVDDGTDSPTLSVGVA